MNDFGKELNVITPDSDKIRKNICIAWGMGVGILILRCFSNNSSLEVSDWVACILLFFLGLLFFRQFGDIVIIYEHGFYIRTSGKRRYILYEDVQYMTYKRHRSTLILKMRFRKGRGNKKLSVPVSHFDGFTFCFQYVVDQIYPNFRV